MANWNAMMMTAHTKNATKKAACSMACCCPSPTITSVSHDSTVASIRMPNAFATLITFS
jgi:hypothetical protein